MYCPYCGTKNDNSANFCIACGASIKNEDHNIPPIGIAINNNTSNGNKIAESKYSKSIAITNSSLGAVLLYLSFTSEYDWTLAPFCLGIGICTTGILQLLKKNQKTIAILQIVMGALCTLIFLELAYDWDYIGFVTGVGMLTIGILNILRKSSKIVSIVEIVFASVSILLGLAFISWAWSDTGLFTGAAFLVEGILNIKNSPKVING